MISAEKERLAKQAHEKLIEQGYYLAAGAAIVNDVALVGFNKPHSHILTFTLRTQESCNCFNAEAGEDFQLYRKEQ